jgi:hypothetical protein
MATYGANQGISTFSLRNFTCGTQEALSDRARRPEFTREDVTMTQEHQLIWGTHRWSLPDTKEIMDSRNAGMRQTVMPQKKRRPG